ncbi:hypothetical protein PSY30_23545, partial [Shigella flexneri]|nr:hypothetical protein [Shigella flexneri]
ARSQTLTTAYGRQRTKKATMTRTRRGQSGQIKMSSVQQILLCNSKLLLFSLEVQVNSFNSKLILYLSILKSINH